MAAGPAKCQGGRIMSKDKDEKKQRLAAALRENLKRRKAQAREVLPGTGRGTATRSGVVEGAGSEAHNPLHQPPPSAAAGPPPRPGED
jgi:hypothetical protein